MQIERVTQQELQQLLFAAPQMLRRNLGKHGRHLEGLRDEGELRVVWTTWRAQSRPGVLNFAVYCLPGYGFAGLYGRKITAHLWSLARANEALRCEDSLPQTEFTRWLVANEAFIVDRQWVVADIDAQTLKMQPAMVNAGRVLSYQDLLQRPQLLNDFAIQLYRRVRRELNLNTGTLNTRVILRKLGEMQIAAAPLLLLAESRVVAFAVTTQVQGGACIQVMSARESTNLRILLPFIFDYLRRIYPQVKLVWRSDDHVSAEVRRWLPLSPAPMVETYYALRPLRLTEL
jgi:hypothetical protein